MCLRWTAPSGASLIILTLWAILTTQGNKESHREKATQNLARYHVGKDLCTLIGTRRKRMDVTRKYANVRVTKGSRLSGGNYAMI